MIGKCSGTGKKILERWPVDFFQISRAAVSRIEVVSEERAKINLVEGIFFLFRGSGRFHRQALLGLFPVVALARLFTSGYLIQQRYGRIKLLQHGVLYHFSIDHLFEFELVERQYAHHLHEPRCEDLLLVKSTVVILTVTVCRVIPTRIK